jgi:hypothetical protein
VWFCTQQIFATEAQLTHLKSPQAEHILRIPATKLQLHQFEAFLKQLIQNDGPAETSTPLTESQPRITHDESTDEANPPIPVITHERKGARIPSNQHT